MVEIIPKPPEKPPLWLNILFYLSLGLLVATILSFFLLNYLQNHAISELKQLKITITKTPEEQEIEERVLQFQKRIADFALLLSQHQKNSNMFSFFEKVIHPRVQITKFKFTKPATLSISGKAENFVVLSQQLTLFEKDPQIKKTDLSSFSLGEEGVDFTFLIQLSPEIFKFQ